MIRTKKEIISKVKESKNNTDNSRNIMGCLECWYDPYYALSQVFSEEVLNNMSEQELNNLILLAETIQENLYYI